MIHALIHVFVDVIVIVPVVAVVFHAVIIRVITSNVIFQDVDLVSILIIPLYLQHINPNLKKNKKVILSNQEIRSKIIKLTKKLKLMNLQKKKSKKKKKRNNPNQIMSKISLMNF